MSKQKLHPENSVFSGLVITSYQFTRDLQNNETAVVFGVTLATYK